MINYTEVNATEINREIALFQKGMIADLLFYPVCGKKMEKNEWINLLLYGKAFNT